MVENIKMEDITEASPSEVKEEVVVTETKVEDTPTTDEQDPLKEELERVRVVEKTQPKRTQAEKLLYTKKRIEEQLRELGVDEEEQENDENTPVTIAMLRKMQFDTVEKTAVQLAEDIPNETERELTKFHIQNTIRSTGNAKEDLRLAQILVNSVKNTQIKELVNNKIPAKTHSTATSAPAMLEDIAPELSADELVFTRPPFNLSKEQVIKTRR